MPFSPPINSTIMSISFLSDNKIVLSTHSTCVISKSLFKFLSLAETQMSWKSVFDLFFKNLSDDKSKLATLEPTVPRPAIAILKLDTLDLP